MSVPENGCTAEFEEVAQTLMMGNDLTMPETPADAVALFAELKVLISDGM